MPNFLIIGTAKAGTTALYHHLTKHPNIHTARTKELRFFTENYEKGLQWYRKQFPSLVNNIPNVITGEATPDYLDYSPEIPKRVYNVMPNAKLIVLLRNPVDRAYSFYHLQLRMGQYQRGNDVIPFEEVIKEDLKIPNVPPKSLSLHGALYSKHLQNWFKVFPRNQILIMKSEELYKETSKYYSQVLRFLELPEWQPRNLYYVNQREYTKLSEDTRRKLISYFEPHNKKLYKLLGRNFGWEKEG
ncbi:hypothetical protein BTR23_13930 [Alkalihalophilus pseudofirmus]|nr:hypothetical protein BTR23_13930 [Alkalihalophilus pseudofirmus]